ncbi:3-hydroxyacyl-CoA dehydrogenase family protein [Jannaschia sp. W003]|uniref:3-hydroxyacyl-CoA dehydrogenase family protein n=1 Tax=Jannaschia sp. W003 TaxID=2867012 RepID=UPI0021A54D4F|nr:3-hydroxyacyl-CoA dehydrogenase family protein [Jannaschia sp. W003]UWQ21797.1 3-hydroxyacyl-CoA dehydrogenase family protein [Jannaschia sp. W003]
MADARGHVGVVGAGTMGTGIVYVFAMAGFAVHLVEPDAAGVERARGALREAADGAVARGKVERDESDARLARIAVHGDAADLPEALDLVVETVPERRALKMEVLARIAARAPRLIATNTSAMSIDDLASAVADPSRFLGMHFFNPVWSLKLVEIVRGPRTDAGAVADACAFAEAIGKGTAVVADSPGFATSRLDLVQALEAIRMVEAGVASPEDIDRAVTAAYRHPVGPLRLSDMVGLDVRLDIARQLAGTLGAHFAPPRLLEEMVARGDLGAKSGRGFYDWPQGAAPMQAG